MYRANLLTVQNVIILELINISLFFLINKAVYPAGSNKNSTYLIRIDSYTDYTPFCGCTINCSLASGWVSEYHRTMGNHSSWGWPRSTFRASWLIIINQSEIWIHDNWPITGSERVNSLLKIHREKCEECEEIKQLDNITVVQIEAG